MGPREGPDFAYVMMNNLNRKTVAAMLSTNGLGGFNTPVGDMLWLEEDTSFVKTEHKVRVVLKVYMSEKMQCSLGKQV